LSKYEIRVNMKLHLTPVGSRRTVLCRRSWG